MKPPCALCLARSVLLVVLAVWLAATQAQPVDATIQPRPGAPRGIFVLASCKPTEAASSSARVTVRCETRIDKRFRYFAVSTEQDPRFAARALSIIEAAQLGDKYLNILFDANDTTGQQWGCTPSDCRP